LGFILTGSSKKKSMSQPYDRNLQRLAGSKTFNGRNLQRLPVKKNFQRHCVNVEVQFVEPQKCQNLNGRLQNVNITDSPTLSYPNLTYPNQAG
jgi:hypothetical protein